jgi:carbamoyltransferase
LLIGYHRSHEASVVAIDDAGRPLHAISEERLSRVKMQGGWPRLAAAWLEERVDTAGARLVHGGLPLARRFPRELELALWNALHGKLQDVHPKRFRKLADVALGRAGRGRTQAGRAKDDGAVFRNRPRTHVDHHTCHAASAYYPSGFDEAEVVTVDGVGDTYSCRFFRGKSGRLEPRAQLFHTDFPLGHNYEFVTTLLGFHPHRHAGKVTGLAGHGRVEPRLVAQMDAWTDEIWSAKQGRPYFFMLHSQHGETKGDPHFEAAVRELRETRTQRFGDWSDA